MMKYKKYIFGVIRKVGRLVYGRNIFLFSDRPHMADDNGEALYKYFLKNNIKAVFAIKKESEDYERLAKIGKVVEYDSILHKFLLCTCEAHISSHLTHMENHEEIPQIFLQHGITVTDISPYINPSSHSNFYIITSLKSEYDSIKKEPYKVIPSHVLPTGLPRYDYLYNDPKKIITISFTWRPNLYYQGEEEFLQSEYFKKYKDILGDKNLMTEISNYGYCIYLKLHPAMQKFVKCFEEFSYINIWEEKYSDIFAKSDLLITDFSSIAYDFSYLRKPILYYQSDIEEFWKVALYNEGEMNYEEKGLGDVVYKYDDLKAKVLSYVRNGCEMEEKYLNRVESLFIYCDKNNCERVYEQIRKIVYK